MHSLAYLSLAVICVVGAVALIRRYGLLHTAEATGLILFLLLTSGVSWWKSGIGFPL